MCPWDQESRDGQILFEVEIYLQKGWIIVSGVVSSQIVAAVIIIKTLGLVRGSIISISDVKILYCILIIFWFLKQTNWNIESSLCEKLNQPQQSEQPICWRVSGVENYSNLFITSPATYLVLLLLKQPITY